MLYLMMFFVIILLLIEKFLNKNKKEEIKENNNTNYKELYEKKEYIMTSQEYKFYKLLKNIAKNNNQNIFAQVSLYSLVKNKNYKDFNKIKSKSIDYVLTDTNGKVKICIELDDNTHIKENRQERDKFINELFKQLDIKLLRIPVQNYYNMQEIEEKIKNLNNEQ